MMHRFLGMYAMVFRHGCSFAFRTSPNCAQFATLSIV